MTIFEEDFSSALDFSTRWRDLSGSWTHAISGGKMIYGIICPQYMPRFINAQNKQKAQFL